MTCQTKQRSFVFAACVLLLALIFVWPGVYRYDKIHVPSEDHGEAMRGVYKEQIVRINRVTGSSEVLAPTTQR